MKREKRGKVAGGLLVMLLAAGIFCGCGQVETQGVQGEDPVAEETMATGEVQEEKITEEKAEEIKEDAAGQKEPEKQESKEKNEETVLPGKEQAADQEESEETDELQVDWSKVKTYDIPVTLYAQSIVNIRKGPGTDFEKAGLLSTNDAVEAVGECTENNWKMISYQGEKAFVSGKYLGENQIDLVALQAEQEAAAMAAIEAEKQKQAEQSALSAAQNQGTQAGGQPAPAPKEPEPAYIASPAGVVFVGDSRCVQMQAAVGGGGSTWICENSKRYSWFQENAVPRLDNIVGKGTKIVICMGVNDPWDYNQYAALANQKAAEWAARGATTYFVSVNPVWENPYVTQDQVDTFNANMPGLLSGVRWIDTAGIVKQGGYRLVDGLHYDTSAYINIFNLICGSL